MKQTILRKYARLIARTGANIQKGQDVIIERCPTSSVSALRKVLEKYA